MIIKPHVISSVYILFELWEHPPEMLNRASSCNDKPTQSKCCHTIGARRSGNLWDPAGGIDANGVGWRCECSCWSCCAGNVHQMNSCPPGSAAHSACSKNCHTKHSEKGAHKALFQLERAGRCVSHCSYKKKYLNIYGGFMLISMSGGFI